jgi:hypothetical protein
MKKVNLEKTESIRIRDLNDKHIIGIQGDFKYQIVRLDKSATKSDDLFYQLVRIGDDNLTTNGTGNSIKSVIENLATYLKIEVFVFEDIAEFYGWLAETQFIKL